MPSQRKKQYSTRNAKKRVVDSDSSSSSESEDEQQRRSTKTKKRIIESDSSSSSESESEYKPSSNETDEDGTIYTECNDSDDVLSGDEESEEAEEFDHKEFRKTLAKMFPSKYSKERATESASKKKDAEKSTSKRHQKKKPSKYDSSDDDEECESSDSETEAKSRKYAKKSKDRKSSHRKKKARLSSSDEDDSEAEAESEIGKGKISLILNVGGGEEDDYDFDDDEYELESLVEDVTEEFDSDAEKTFMGEAYEEIMVASKPTKADGKSAAASPSDKKRSGDDEHHKKRKSKNKDKTSKKHPATEEDKDPLPEDIEAEYKEMLEVKKMLTDQLKRRPKNRILRKSLEDCNAGIKKLTRKARHANTNAYYKLVNSEKRQTNEIDYFKHKLSNKEQQGIMADLKEINRSIYADKPYRLALLQSKIPAKFKMVAMQRLNALKTMEPGDHEYYKIKNWVDAFMRIPFGVYRSIHIRKSDGIDVCDQFMEGARKTLNDCVYGLNDAKLQIMQMLGQWIVNPDSVGTAIAIHGPPGTGKTSIVKDGISKILGREFAFIALGGCGDGSFLEGHSYTYEGSAWGKIAQILMECKSMNPIIYFDELDKVSDTARGQEIIGILTHLTDTTQNSEFHDKYFSEVSLDLSKCLFIFSYNDEHLVNPILKDRMYRIQTTGYDTKEKITIARDYMLPKIREQVSFDTNEIVIPDETLHYLISTPHLTKSESGVRNLKRCLEIIYTKLNLYRLVKPGNPMFEKDLGVKVAFPITITRKEVDIFIKNNETLNPSILAMYL